MHVVYHIVIHYIYPITKNNHLEKVQYYGITVSSEDGYKMLNNSN